MAERTITCPNCGTQFEFMHHRRARWMATGAGVVLGAAATRSLLGGVLMGALSYGIATMIDEYHAHRCPECAVIVSGPTRQVQVRRERAPARREREAEKPARREPSAAARREKEAEKPARREPSTAARREKEAEKPAKREPAKAKREPAKAKREQQPEEMPKARTAKQAT